ncbi:MAG: hypothetical protein ACRDGA_08795, partial [Bacteroidota bacterium]
MIFEDPYRKVLVKQVDAAQVSFGQFGKLRSGAFTLFSERDFWWPVGSNQTLQADQNFKTSTTQKYHDWSTTSDVVNHRSFPITEQTTELKAQFTQTQSAITVRTELIDGGTGGNIEFKDPWLIDEEVNVGNQVVYRNRGMNALFVSKASPFVLSDPANTLYKGVFLNQEFTGANPVYYSVNAPAQTINGFTSYFQNWTVTSGQADFQNANAAQTAVVFRQTNTTVTARYKANMGSSTSAATAFNNQRKILYHGGKYHVVYESAGDIWYTTSSDDGATWAAEVRISDGSGMNRHPHIAVNQNTGPDRPYIAATWEKFDAPQSASSVYLSHRDNSTGTWESPLLLFGPIPVLSGFQG